MVLEVLFLTKSQTKQEFAKSDYLQTIMPEELGLRRRGVNTRIDLIQHYYKSVMDFTYEEKNRLESIIKNAYLALEKQFPNLSSFLMDNGLLQVGKVEGSLDWYFPYTLNMTIIIPQKIIISNSDEELTKTFVHEMIHLHQKKMPYFYEEIYKNNFGFEKINAEKVIITSNYEKMLITNPDGMVREWIIQLYDGLYLPALIFVKGKHYSCLFRLKQSSNDGYYLAEEDPILAHGRKDYIDMIQNCKDQIDHPNEIIACIITSNIFKK